MSPAMFSDGYLYSDTDEPSPVPLERAVFVMSKFPMADQNEPLSLNTVSKFGSSEHGAP